MASPRETLQLSRFFAFSPFFPAPWFPGIPLAAFVFPLQSIPFVGQIFGLLFSLAMAASFLLCLIPSRIVVGPDGIEHRWLFWRRFFALRDVRALAPTFALPARLVLRDGRKAWLPYTFSPRNDFFGEHSPALLAIEAAIRWAQEQPATDATDATHLAERAGAGAAALRARIATDGGYRTEAVAEETLWRIVDDPSQSADARGAAAVLLAPGADAETRARIGELAATTANTRLRVLLEGAAEGAPDDEIARRFDAMSER
jgi:hypothetical protein